MDSRPIGFLFMWKLRLLLAFFVAVVAFGMATPALAVQSAGNAYMRASRMQAGQAPGSVLVVFQTSSVVFTETLFKITLDSEWVSATNFSATAGNYTISTAGLPAGVTAMPGVATATNVTANTISFPITDLTISTTYGFFITGTGLILNPAATTTQVHTLFTTNAVPTTNDTKDINVPTITADQITVTATVPPTFSIALGSTTAALGTLSTGSISSGAGNTVTISTNAGGGWTGWVRSTNAGLTSTNVSYTIATAGTINAAPSTLSAGTEGYVLDADLTTDGGAGGTVTIDPEYLGTTTSQGGTLSTTFQAFASANGPANGDVITLVPRVAISNLTEAASDYTDTLTVVAAGIF